MGVVLDPFTWLSGGKLGRHVARWQADDAKI
jgi:hypothetical protein